MGDDKVAIPKRPQNGTIHNLCGFVNTSTRTFNRLIGVLFLDLRNRSPLKNIPMPPFPLDLHS